MYSLMRILPPVVLCICACAAPARVRPTMDGMLFSFQSKEELRRWSAVNDGVMGGVSDGRVDVMDGVLRFQGTVSLERNGGFASIRTDPVEMDLSDFTGIQIRVHGDGNRYAFNLRTDFQIMAGSYRVKFDTVPDKWIELYLPFDAFEATSFGVPMNDAPALNLRRVLSMGFLISDKQAGPFRLDVAWIKAVSSRAEGGHASLR